MRKPGFWLVEEDPDPAPGKPRETVREGFVCSHCGRATLVKQGEAIGRCSLCMGKDGLQGLICNQCLAKKKCITFEKRLEMVEAGKLLWTDINKI